MPGMIWRYRVVFNCSSSFSVPKWKKKTCSANEELTLKMSWKSSFSWLQLVFHFGSENQELKNHLGTCNSKNYWCKVISANKENLQYPEITRACLLAKESLLVYVIVVGTVIVISLWLSIGRVFMFYRYLSIPSLPTAVVSSTTIKWDCVWSSDSPQNRFNSS